MAAMCWWESRRCSRPRAWELAPSLDDQACETGAARPDRGQAGCSVGTLMGLLAISDPAQAPLVARRLMLCWRLGVQSRDADRRQQLHGPNVSDGALD